MSAFVPDKKEQSQSIEQFLREIEDDFGAPNHSKFQDYIPKCRKNVQSMEEVRRWQSVVAVRQLACLLPVLMFLGEVFHWLPGADRPLSTVEPGGGQDARAQAVWSPQRT